MAESVNPPLAPENVLKQMTLVVECCEDLQLEDVQLELQFTYPEDTWPTKIIKDWQHRGALDAIIKAGGGSPDMPFEFVPIDQTMGQQPSLRPAAAIQRSGK